MLFVKFNKRTKRFSATVFSTGVVVFTDLKQIPKQYGKNVIIYHSQGNNIHPSLWSDKWFE